MEAKATVDWRMVGEDWENYLAQAGEHWREAFVPVIQALIADRGKQLATQFGMQFDVQNLFARDWFNEYMLKFAQPINQTTSDAIATMLAQAQEEGWAIPTMQSHLGDMFEQWMAGDLSPSDFEWFADRLPPYRTEMIARTETIRASNAGSTEIYKEWGVKKHEWIATLDDRVRDEHLEANGQIVNMDEPFSVGGESLMYPGDPSGSAGNTINCRCTTAPVVEEGEELQPEEAIGPEVFTPATNLEEAMQLAQSNRLAIATNPSDIAEMLADTYEKRYGWEGGKTREEFIRRQIELLSDSKVPDQFKVDVINGITEQINSGQVDPLQVIIRGERQGFNDKWIAGTYSPEMQYIEVVYHPDQPSVAGQIFGMHPSDIPATYQNQFGGLYIHEYGHHYSETLYPEVFRRAQAIDLDDKITRDFIKDNISRYAVTEARELAAESFALWKHPDFELLSDDIKDFIKRIVSP